MRRVLKIALYVLVVLVVVLIGAYLLLTREWFLKSQLLPRISKAVGAPVTVKTISLAPFSRIELTGLQVGEGATPFLKAGTVRCRYSLLAILGGEINVSELLLDGVRVHAIQDAAGKWNLPQPPASPKAAEPKTPASAKTARPPRLALTNIQVRDLQLVVDELAGAEPVHLEVTGVGLRLPELKAGQPVKLAGEGDLKFTQGQRIAITAGHGSSTLTAELGPDFLPDKLLQEKRVTGLAGHVDAIDLAGRELLSRIEIVRDGKAFTIKEFRIEESVAGKPETTLLVTGRIQPQPLELTLDVTANPISASALNLIGALAAGLDFGDTTARYAGHVAVDKGTMLVAQGKLELSKLTVRATHRQLPPMPPLEFTLEHNVTVDIQKKSARLTVLKADLKDAQTDIFRLELLEPTVFAWGGTGPDGVTAAPAKLNLTVNKLDLALAAPFVRSSSPVALRSGTVSGALVAEIAEMGKNVRLSGSLVADRVQLTASGKELPPLSLDSRLRLTLRDLNLLDGSLQSSLRVSGAPALEVNVTLTAFNLTAKEGKAELEVPLVRETLLAALPIQWPAGSPAITALNANAKIAAVLRDKGQSIALRGNVGIETVTLSVPDAAHPTRLQGDLLFNLERKSATEIAVQSLTLNLAQGSQKLVRLDLTGTVLLPAAKGTAKTVPTTAAAGAPLKATLGIDQFNLLLLAPFLPAQSPVAIRSGTLTVAATATTTDMGETLKFDGTLTADQAQLALSGKELPPLLLQETFDGSLRDLKLLAARANGTLAVGQTPAVKMTLVADYDLTKKEGTADIELPLITDALLKLMPMAWPPSVPAVSTLSGSAKITASAKDKGETVSAHGTLTLDRLVLAASADGTPAELRCGLGFDADEIGLKVIHLRNLTLNVDQGKESLANLGVAGTVYLPPAKTESVVNITSDGINGQALAKLLPPAPKTATPASPPVASSTPAEPAAVNVGDLWLTAKLDLKNIRYGEVEAAKLAGVVHVKDNRVEIKPLDLTLNGAPVHLETSVDLSKPGYEYSLAANLTGLALAPLVATFAPTLKDKIQGNVKSLDVKLTGAGITPPNLRRNFRGNLTLAGEQVAIEKLPFLATLASQTGIPELQELHFDTVTAQVHDEKGVLRLQQLNAAGRDLKLDVTGTVGFDVKLDLLLRIGVGGTVLTEMQQSKWRPALGKQDGNYVMLALAMPLRGYPNELRTSKLILDFLQENLKQNAVNTIGNVLNDATGGKKIDPKSLIKGILGGETDTPAPQTPPAGNVAPAPGTPTPAPTPAETPPKKPKKTRDLLLDIGAGLLQNATEGKK